jgi:uncharacterized membrane protein YfcA
MAIVTIISALMSGAVVGALLGLFGGGGGGGGSVLATPLLLYVVGVKDPHVAIGTSAAAVAVNAATNLVGHGRGGRVKWPCATVFAAAGLLGSFMGSSLAKAVGRWHWRCRIPARGDPTVRANRGSPPPQSQAAGHA